MGADQLDGLIPATLGLKSGWMDPTVRQCLISIRPWSLPTSVVPIAVTAALIKNSDPERSLYASTFILSALVVLLLHCGANLLNTFYDFKTGLDTAETADDRALVDNNVSVETVWRMAVGFIGGGVLSAVLLAQVAGPKVYYLAVPAAVLAVLYSADPFRLKGKGMGEVVIFLMFGPMLMGGVSLAVTNSIDMRTLLYSVPLGLLTVAVLHVNNSRDVEADKKAGLFTLAIHLKQEANVKLFSLLMLSAYVAVAVLAVVTGTSCRQGLVLLCAPWALYTIRRAKAKLYFELPQYVAQHNLMFGVILTSSLSSPMFTARVMIACLYLLGGINNIVMWQHSRALVHMKLTNIFPSLGLTTTLVMFAGAVAFQIAVSLAFMLGFETLLMAQLLLLWILPVTFVSHDFWTIERDHPAHDWSSTVKEKVYVASRKVPIFLTEFDNEFVHLFKNVGMAGALVLYIELADKIE